MAFNRDRFQALATTTWVGQPLHVLDQVDSTNAHLWQLQHRGARPGTAVLALTQAAGRGQWGRTWVSAPGGLYLSVLVRPQIPTEESAQLTVCIALGLAIALRNQGIPVDLKWPNDLLLHHKKLGGILTETVIQSGQIQWAVIGIGINWCNPTPDTGISLVSPANQDNGASRSIASLEALTAIALQGIEQGYERWQQEGIAGILPDYLRYLKVVTPSPVTVKFSQTLTLQLTGA